MRVASLDFREASSRNWTTLQRSVPLLIEQGIRFFDCRGIEWIDVKKGASWPSDVLVETEERVVDLEDTLFREGIVFRAAERLLRDEDEEGEEGEGEDEEDSQRDEGEGGEKRVEKAFKVELNDQLLVVYLSSLIRSVLALHDLSEWR